MSVNFKILLTGDDKTQNRAYDKIFKIIDNYPFYFNKRHKEEQTQNGHIVGFYHLPQEVAFKIITDIQVAGIDTNDCPEFCDAYIESAKLNGKEMTEEQLEAINENKDFVYEAIQKQLY